MKFVKLRFREALTSSESGTDGARTHDLPHVKRTLIPAELRFHPLAFGFLLAANKSHYIGQLPVMQALFLIFFQLFFRWLLNP